MFFIVAAPHLVCPAAAPGNTPLQMIEKKRAAETLPSYLPCYDAEIAVRKAASAQ